MMTQNNPGAPGTPHGAGRDMLLAAIIFVKVEILT